MTVPTTSIAVSSALDPSISESTTAETRIIKPTFGRELDQVHHPRKEERILYNWSGLTAIANKAQIRYPKSEEELASIVQQARKVRVVGNALSYEAISSVDSPPSPSSHTVVVSLQQPFVGLRQLNKDKGTATFGASTSIDEVIRELAHHGYMMTACPGVIGIQTLAGSISTGTHGQGLHQSDYAGTVQSFRIVLPSGSIRTMTPRDPQFHLHLVSLGLLGILTELEISVKPRRLYTCIKLSCTYQEFMANYHRWNETAEFCKVWWFPNNDICQVWLVNPSTANEIAYHHAQQVSPHDAQPVTYRNSTDAHTMMHSTIHEYISAMAHDTNAPPTSGEPQFHTLTRFTKMETVIGWVEQILTKGTPVPQINCEIAVPLEKFQDATKALHAWSAAHPKKLHYPFIYRATGASSALMSACHRGPVVWIGFLVYIPQAGNVPNGGMKTMRELQQVLARFQGVPHWGKHFYPELFAMEEQLTRSVWARFVAEMHWLDPTHKMVSPFLRNLFLSPSRQLPRSLGGVESTICTKL